MGFNLKLQELRRQKGLTQEELAKMLFVSRTAVSKWEQGKGYPNIDTLVKISKIFSISIDELLDSNELLNIAEEDVKKNKKTFCDLIFGLCDISTVLLLFLPFFAQRTSNGVFEVSLISLSGISLYLKIIFYGFVLFSFVFGVLILTFQNLNCKFWNALKTKISLFLSIFGVVLFILTLMPYASVFLLVFLVLKILIILIK